MKDFEERTRAYQARVRAIYELEAGVRAVQSRQNLLAALAVVGGTLFVWTRPTVRCAICTVAVFVFFRFLSNLYVHFAHEAPGMRKLDEDFPMPPPRERR